MPKILVLFLDCTSSSFLDEITSPSMATKGYITFLNDTWMQKGKILRGHTDRFNSFFLVANRF